MAARFKLGWWVVLVPLAGAFAVGRVTAEPAAVFATPSTRAPRCEDVSSTPMVVAPPIMSVSRPHDPLPVPEPRIELSRAPACRDATMRGIIVAEDTRESMALLGVGATTEWRRRGDPIGDYRVLNVANERAWLVRGSAAQGKYAVCQTELGSRAEPNERVAVAAVPSNASGPGPLAHLGARIEKRGKDDFVLDRSVIEEMVEQQGSLAALVRAQPDFEGGRTVGLSLKHVRPGSVLETLGLKSGDRLRSVAGVELTSVESGLTALARLRANPRFALEIVRDGKPAQLDYEVR